MAINEEFLNELISKTDIENVISQYVSLKRNGRLLKGLCPFHSEKSASFFVYPETQSFYCFGCGAGGDAITFIRSIENLDYIESVKLLADKAGLNMPDEGYDDTLSIKKKRMLEINKEAARFFHEYMLSENGKKGLDYFLNRGLSLKTIRGFGLGYAPDSWDSLLKYMRQKGFSNNELYEADLAKKSVKDNNTRYYDNFRNRVIIPIIDLRGNIIAFGGRVLDSSLPKYINTSDTLIYKKSHGVFALNFAKNGNVGKLILSEGYMDVIALHQAGFTNAVASLGTALTDDQAMLISRYCNEIVISYDSDEAGRKATEKAIEKFSKTGLKVRVLKLEGGKDPDEIIKLYGAERFRALLEGASNDIEYKLLIQKAKYDITTDDGKLNYLKDAVLILSTLNSKIERDIYASRLSDELSVSKDAILNQTEQLIKSQKKKESRVDFNQLNKTLSSIDNGHISNIKSLKAEEILISSLICNPDFYNKIEGGISAEIFTSDFYKRLYESLSKKLNEAGPIELSFFSSEFSPREMGKIAKLQNMGSLISNTVNECEDCIKVLKDEKNSHNEKNISETSNEEFLEEFLKRFRKE